jgi:hypothetical protein
MFILVCQKFVCVSVTRNPFSCFAKQIEAYEQNMTFLGLACVCDARVCLRARVCAHACVCESNYIRKFLCSA